MTREDFRREIGHAFEAISGSPSPALSDRVRSALLEAPERRGPIWIAGLAAALIAVLLVGVLVFGNLNRHQPNVGSAGTHSSPTPSPAASHSPSATPTPVPSSAPSATPVATPTPGLCASPAPITVQNAPPVAFIDAVRTGTHAGYDRLTIEFKNGQPGSIEVRSQSGTTFTLSPRGDTVTLSGQSGILVVIHGSDAHTNYSGSTDIKTGYPGLLEVRQLEDFEGQVQFGLGLTGQGCFSVSILTNPVRLVIDIQTK